MLSIIMSLDDLNRNDTLNHEYFHYETGEKTDIAKVAIMKNDSAYQKEDLLICSKCTTKWAAIFVGEMDPDDVLQDPVLLDIASKKFYMERNEEHKHYKCPNCGEVRPFVDQIQKDNPKILKAAGLESHPEYKKITKATVDYIRPLAKKETNLNKYFNYDYESSGMDQI